jgi:hypothetical protein
MITPNRLSKKIWPLETPWLFVALIAILLACLVVRSRESVHKANKSDALSSLPAVILWAWERPENLGFIDTHKVAVAFLAKTISLRGDRVTVRPRLQPLQVPTGTKMIAVARVESDRTDQPALSDMQLAAAVGEISEMANIPNVVAVQVDFDATRSEREFYQSAIFRLRKQLPASIPLSITALASWCSGDDWLSVLPIDEAVPMLFRMGIDRRQILSRLEAGERFNSRPCKVSAGVSVDEPVAIDLRNERLYIFSPQAWTADTFKAAMEEYHK